MYRHYSLYQLHFDYIKLPLTEDIMQRNQIARKYARAPTGKRYYRYKCPFTLGEYEVLYKKPRTGKIEVSVWDGDVGVATMTLDPFLYKFQPMYRVSWISVDEDYAGQNIGYQLYKGLVSIMGVNLIQTESQSPGARKIWARLSQDTKIRAWGFDTDADLVFKVKPNKSGNELQSCRRGIKIYNDDYSGIAMVKRNSKIDRFFSAMQTASALAMGKIKSNPWGIKRFSPVTELR